MKYLRNILKGISLTAAMFVFQACYGTPQDDYRPYSVSFHVVGDEGEPIPNVDIQVQPQSGLDDVEYDWDLLRSTDSAGMGRCYVEDLGLPNKFRFSDRDSVYAVKDTVITQLTDNDTIDIVLHKLS